MNSVTQQSSTAFQDDGRVTTKIARSILNSSGPVPFDQNEVADFLGKPVIISSGTVSTADAKGTLKYSTSIATAMEAQQIWYRKLAGYNMIRATAVLKLVVNANPFQAGRLVMTFVPCFRHLNSTEQAARSVDNAQDTVQPNVELDIADSSAEFEIPYITPTYYYNRELQWYDWGTVFLKVLSPLVVGSGGETDYEYTLFLSFKDVELAAPIYGPESSLRSGPKAQTRARRNDMTLYKESSQASGGVITSTAAKIAAASDVIKTSVFTKIPIVGTAISMGSEFLSGAASAVSSVASLFGWSKPLSQEAQVSFFTHPFKWLANSDGVMASDVPSFTSNPLVIPNFSTFGTSVDEMSMPFLRKIPSQFSEFNWATTAVAGTALYTLDLTPANLVRTLTKTSGANTTSYVLGSPLFMLSRMFNYYRGGVEITFKFVKTTFHSGRLAVVFEPKAGANTSLAQSPYVLREIVDLRSANTLTLKIPFLFGSSYRSTGFGNTARVSSQLDVSLGTLRVIVLNELRAPETTTSTIQTLVYANPADDFELALPIPNRNALFSPESGLSSVMNQKLEEKGIGNSEIEVDPSHFMKCTSDPVLSLKQLLTSARRILCTDSGISSGFTCYLFPQAAALFRESGSTNLAGPAGGLFGDYISFLTSGYAFSRGGIRLVNGGISTTASSTIWMLPTQFDDVGATSVLPTGAVLQPWNAAPLTANTMAPIVNRTGSGGACDLVVPFYSKTPIRMNRFQSATHPAVYWSLSKDPLPDSPTVSVAIQGGLNNNTWFRSGADDFCLGYFIGFMPLAVSRV